MNRRRCRLSRWSRRCDRSVLYTAPVRGVAELWEGSLQVPEDLLVVEVEEVAQHPAGAEVRDQLGLVLVAQRILLDDGTEQDVLVLVRLASHETILKLSTKESVRWSVRWRGGDGGEGGERREGGVRREERPEQVQQERT